MNVDEHQSLSKIRTCKVCGDAARMNNYGALSCHSCKTFFRRNGFHPELVRPCQYDGQCEVDMLTRKVCTACRLRKCFAVGMSTDLIRKEDLHHQKSSSKIKSNKTQVASCKTETPVSQLPTLDLLNNDRSLLTTSQWITFSNVIHAFDTFSIVPALNAFLKNSSSTMDQIHFTMGDALKTIGSSYAFMQSFVSSVPDFQVLSTREQQSLLDRNLHGGATLCSNIFYRDSHLFDHAECCFSYIELAGPELFQQLKLHTGQLDPDSTILKVMLLILVFSSNSFTVDIQKKMSDDSLLHGTFRLLGSQNFYVEILWKYMVYRYGYDETVIRFAQIVRCIVSKIGETAVMYMNNDILYDYVDEISDTMKGMLVNSQNQVIPLWGKTLPISWS